ncbi:hypothetical protein HanRHA438_Chr15g0727891 [Helianthus annuus]|nr:hypothetical protein HanRHA438_Chr15g0727891 [Helianthus annuus]
MNKNNIHLHFSNNTIDFIIPYLLFKKKSKLQVLSFIFTLFCRRCPLAQKLTSFVLNVSKFCTLYPLGQTQLDFLVKYGHMPYT